MFCHIIKNHLLLKITDRMISLGNNDYEGIYSIIKYMRYCNFLHVWIQKFLAYQLFEINPI